MFGAKWNIYIYGIICFILWGSWLQSVSFAPYSEAEPPSWSETTQLRMELARTRAETWLGNMGRQSLTISDAPVSRSNKAGCWRDCTWVPERHRRAMSVHVYEFVFIFHWQQASTMRLRPIKHNEPATQNLRISIVELWKAAGVGMSQSSAIQMEN